MKKSKKRVAVLYGGKGAEREISLVSGKFVLKLLDPEIFDILPIFIDPHGDWFSDEAKRLRPVFPTRKNGVGGVQKGRRFLKIDAAFPVLHGDFGEDGRIQGLLESLGIPFVGCDTVTGAVCADKGFTKAVAKTLDIPTLPWLSSGGAADEDFCKRCEAELGLPLFIKPSRLGSSIGAAPAKSPEELRSRIRLAGDIGGGNVIVEKYLKGPRELECAFLTLGGVKYISAPGEIALPSGFYGYAEKYGSRSSAKISVCADVSEEIAEKICTYTGKLTSALGIKGLSRVDFFLLDGELYFNEINTMPGMTEISLYPRLINEIGISPKTLLNGLVTDVLES